VAADAGADVGQALSDTIYALSSGAPPAAIAVVRVSGSRADAALAALAGKLPEPRRPTLASLRRDNQLLDKALVIRFQGPRSVTGEDLVELHLHGGRAVVAGVLEALAGLPGLREAAPGEFTRRAFENGRIDLAEAEGLADLLEAETAGQRRAALALAAGALSRQVENWQARLLGAAAAVEAQLDFDDEGDVPSSGIGTKEIGTLAAELDKWLARPTAERLREGLRVAVAGPPNAGKSSLVNALVGREAAIVTDIPGTTRDLVEAPVSIAGIPFVLTDTAGLRDSDDIVEALGIARARQSMAVADILLWLGPSAEAPPGAVQVHAKADLGPGEGGVSVSSITGAGLAELAHLLVERARTLLPPEGEVALNVRHRAALVEGLAHLREAAGASDPLIAAEALRLARNALDRITGKAGVEHMLDALFGRFCIGK
jgi:tRNA modification GTPase